MIKRLQHPQYKEFDWEWHPETRKLYKIDNLAPLHASGRQVATLMAENVSVGEEAQALVGMFFKGYEAGLTAGPAVKTRIVGSEPNEG